jgi:hypothetical protein
MSFLSTFLTATAPLHSATEPLTRTVSQAGANPALSSMQDIQLPDPVSNWPMAPGYGLLLLLCVASLLLGYFFWRKRVRTRAAQQAALVALSRLSAATPEFATEVNALLKRATMSYLPRAQIAALDGEPWYDWLEAALPPAKQKNNGPMGPLLAKRYRKEGLSEADKLALLRLAQNWLECALPPRGAKC